jgi:tetratricopeptide (TPR) repeat protein
VVLTICSAIFLAYSNSLQGNFVYDDVFFIKESPLIRDLSNVPTIFTSAFWESSSRPVKAFYRPLTVSSYALNFGVGGFEPFGYHLTNVLLHLANALLVFSVAYLLSRHSILSTAVALLFGLHPINTEVVAWISGRGDLLGTFFFLGALVLYMRAYPPERARESQVRIPRWIVGAGLLAFMLGLLAKESVATLVVVLVLYELTFRGSTRGKGVRLVPFIVVLVAYLGWRVTVLGGIQASSIYFVANPLMDEASWPRAFTAIKVFGKYLGLLLFPLRLAVDYSYNQIPVARSFWEPGVLVSGLVATGILRLLFLCWSRNRLVFFGVGFFLVTGSLIFANALFPFTAIFGERFMYLPSVGFVLASAGLAHWGAEWMPNRFRVRTVGLLTALVLAGFFGRTWSRNFDWRDEFSLFRSAAEVNPESALAQFSLATQYYIQGKYALARSGYQKALEIYPNYGQARLGLGNVALAERNFARALEELSGAASLLPDDEQTHIMLGVAYWGLGRLDEAVRETEMAARLNPKNAHVYNNLGNIHLLKGNLQEALSHWEKSVFINPFNAEALYNLASNYERIGEREKARAYYERFVEVAPERMADLRARVRAQLSTLEIP